MHRLTRPVKRAVGIDIYPLMGVLIGVVCETIVESPFRHRLVGIGIDIDMGGFFFSVSVDGFASVVTGQRLGLDLFPVFEPIQSDLCLGDRLTGYGIDHGNAHTMLRQLLPEGTQIAHTQQNPLFGNITIVGV